MLCEVNTRYFAKEVTKLNWPPLKYLQPFLRPNVQNYMYLFDLVNKTFNLLLCMYKYVKTQPLFLPKNCEKK